ncbi:hypothetical protein ACOMHN_030082 [Nucella lapillus]
MLAVSDNFCLAAKIVLAEVTRHDVDVGSYGCKFLYFAGNTTAIYANWLLVLMTEEEEEEEEKEEEEEEEKEEEEEEEEKEEEKEEKEEEEEEEKEEEEEEVGRGGGGGGGRGGRGGGGEDYLEFVSYVWYWVDATFYALLPCVLLAIFNTLIIVGIKRAASIQRQLTEVESTSRSKRYLNQATEKIRQQRQITIMLVVVCVVFVILTLPNCIVFIYKPYWNPEPQTLEEAKYRLVEQIIYLLSDLSHATNFFVYFFSTKKFRDRFLETICCCRKFRRHMSRSSHVGQSQFSDTGSIYVSSFSNGGGGAIPLNMRGSGRY